MKVSFSHGKSNPLLHCTLINNICISVQSFPCLQHNITQILKRNLQHSIKAGDYFSKKEFITTTQLWPTTNCDQQTDRWTVSNDLSFMSCKHRINYIYLIYQ